MGDLGDLKVVLLGGIKEDYHPFRVMGPLLADILMRKGMSVKLVEDRDFLRLDRLGAFDACVVYTSLAKDETLSPEQVGGLIRFVASGNGFVGLHAASYSFLSNHEYLSMLGGRFIEHPPEGRFRVAIVDRDHPITRGLESFEIDDELYILECDPKPLQILLESTCGSNRIPIAWVRPFGEGRVFYMSLGHGPDALGNPTFQRILTRAVEWAGGRTCA